MGQKWLDRPFTIELDGHFIVKCRIDARGAANGHRYKAHSGKREEAVVFELREGYLSSEGWYLGRDDSLPWIRFPERVIWVKERNKVHSCEYTMVADSPKFSTHGMLIHFIR